MILFLKRINILLALILLSLALGIVKFKNNLPPEAVDVGVGATATLVCKKAFYHDFMKF